MLSTPYIEIYKVFLGGFMEKFEDLLDMYLDEQEISKKIQLDDEEADCEKKYSKYKHQFQNTITICEFVSEYLETEHDCNNLKHIGLKSFKNPYVIGASNDFAIKNMEYVLRNEILIVVDSANNPAAYVNPLILKHIETMEQLKYTMNILEKIRIHNLSNIKSLYDQFININNRMKIVNKDYLIGNEILRKLNKKYVLNEIKEYVSMLNINIELIEETKNDIETTLNYEYSIVDKIENIVDDEVDIRITDKINRQNKVKFRSKRKVI